MKMIFASIAANMGFMPTGPESSKGALSARLRTNSYSGCIMNYVLRFESVFLRRACLGKTFPFLGSRRYAEVPQRYSEAGDEL